MKKLAVVSFALAGVLSFSSLALADDVTGGGNFSGVNKGTKALEFGLPAGGGGSVGVEYFLDATSALDLDFVAPGLFKFGKTQDPATGNSTTDLVFDFTIGYKMVKAHEGRVTTFIEPAIELGSDTSNFGDNFHAGIGAVLGVEFWVAPQFSLGGAVGVELNFTNKFNDFVFQTFNTGLFASIYWD
jgi:hypothetical protein